MLSRVSFSPIVVVALVVLFATQGAASTYELSTLWRTGSTPRAGGNMFDVKTFDAPIRISALDINTASTTGSKTLRVYTRPETYKGHEGSAAGWTLHSVIPAITGLGPGSPTHVDIHDLYLPAGTTTGLYVTLETMANAVDGCLVYSDTGGLKTYVGEVNGTSAVQLDLGVGLSYPFGDLFTPRIWNGTVHYDVLDAIPEPQPQIFIHAGNGVVFEPDSKWNTIHAEMAGVPVAMHDSAGVPTGVTATLGSKWTNSSTIEQTGKYAETHPVLAEATDDYMFVTGIGNTGTLTLEGLADTWYRVEMSASRNLAATSVWQNTTLNAAWADGDHNGQGFNAREHGHDAGTVLLWRARPVDGVLTLEVSRQNPDAYLNALIITQLPEPQPQIFIDAGNRHVFSAYDKWNTVHAGMTGPITLYDPDGVPTGVTLTIEGNWTNLSDSTSQTGAYANTHPILAEASSDSIWMGSATGPATGTLTFEGLPTPESWQWYRFEMSCSRSQEALPRWQDVTINGLWADGDDHTGENFNAYTDGFQAGEVLTWDSVVPDENGLVTLTFSTGTNQFGYLNALVIALVPEPSTALLLAFGGVSLAMRRGRRKPHLRPGISHGGNMNAGCDPITLAPAEHDRRGFAMLSRTFLISFVVVVAMAVPVARAADYSLTTLYSATSYTGGNMFNVTTFDKPVRIASLDISSYDAYTDATLRVYTRPGTYVGHETSAGGWTLHSVVPGIDAQSRNDGPTPVDIHDLYLPAGTTTGLYVTYESGAYLSYTNTSAKTYGSPAEQLQLDLGAALSYPFAGGSSSNLFSPRIWNGTVHYDAIDAIPEAEPQFFIDAGNAVVFGPESKWNTVHAGMSSVPIALRDPAGVPTGVTATLAGTWTNSTANIPVRGYEGSVLAEATNDFMYLSSSNSTATLTLDGLADAWYRVEMSASRNSNDNRRQQNVTLNGLAADGDHTGQDFSAYTDGFENGTVLLWRARPTNGTLTLTVSRAAYDAYLNALVVTQLGAPKPQIFIDAGNRHVFSAYDKWNTVHAGMTGPITLYDPDGVPTGVTLKIEGDWTNLSDTADQTGAYASTHPILAEASNDNIWLATNSVGTLTFENLPTPESWQWYRFEMACARSNNPSSAPRIQDVTINGLWADGDDHDGQDFSAFTDGYEEGRVLSWDQVQPDEFGRITLAFATGNANAYLNALVITLVPEPSTALLLVFGGLSLALRRRRSHSGPGI